MTVHITARLAWHDDGWNGAVCRRPELNTYCIGAKSYPGDTISAPWAGAARQKWREWWTGLDSNQRTGNPGRFTVCCL